MNKEKVFGIIKFNILRNMQNKWFIILNVFLLVSCLIMTNIDNIKYLLESHDINLFNEEIVLEVVDKENLVGDKFSAKFDEEDKVEIKFVEGQEYTEETIPDNLVVIEVTSDPETIIAGKVISKEVPDYKLYDPVFEVFDEIRAELFAEKHDIELEDLEIMNSEVNVETIMLAVNEENYEKKEMIKLVSVVIVDFICLMVFSKIASEVAEEKVSRSIEYVLTSVSAKEYLFAKIASIISLIVLQILYSFVYYFMGLCVSGLFGSAALTLNTDQTATMVALDVEIILYILTLSVYGILTLILMSIIQAAISSKTTNMTEAGNTTMLLTMITLFAYFVTLGLITPYTNMTPLIYILSCIPLLSNFFVPAIMIIGQATPLQIVVSLGLLVISIPIAFEICSKIFKNGVLDYTTKKAKKDKKEKVERTVKEEQEHKIKVAKYKNYSFVLGLGMILFTALQFLTDILVSSLVLPMMSSIFNDGQLQLIGMTVTSVVSMYLTAKVFALYTDEPNLDLNGGGDSGEESSKVPKSMFTKEKVRLILIGCFAFAVVQIALPHLLEIIGVNYTMETLFGMNLDGSLLTNILLFIALAVTPAIFEELLYRKAIIDFSKGFGKGFAILLSALLFGIIHMNFAQGILAFVVGLLMGYIYLKSGDIRVTMLLHLLNNAYSSFQMMFGEASTTVKIITIIYLVPIAFGGIILIIKLIKAIVSYVRSKKNGEKTNLILPQISINREELSNLKYMFTNFTFITMLVLLILEFALIETLLRAV